MKHAAFAMVAVAGSLLIAGHAPASGQQASPAAPTAAEVDQHAMQHGPSTGRIGYPTHKDPPAPRHAAAPTDPRLLRPLTQREVGMLYSACVAYPECKIAYSKAVEHRDALERAKASPGGD